MRDECLSEERGRKGSRAERKGECVMKGCNAGFDAGVVVVVRVNMKIYPLRTHYSHMQ